MGKLCDALACCAVATAALAPIEQAAACTRVPVVTVSSEFLHDGQYSRSEADWARVRAMWRTCREVRPGDHRFLYDVRAGRYDDQAVVALALAFENGEFGCERDRGFAFRLLDALVPEPVPFDVGSWRLQQVAQRIDANRPLVSRERYRQLVGLNWLLTNARYSLAEQGWSERDVEQLLARPGAWDHAVAHFGPGSQRLVRDGDEAVTEYGSNPDRDALVFRLLADPASERFDRAKAVSLARTSGSRDLLPAAVKLLLDPAFGAPDIAQAREIAAADDHRELKLATAKMLLDRHLGDEGLEAAQTLLQWYSPYVHLEDPVYRTGAALWQDIGGRLAASDEPRARARGEAILLTGDPQAGRVSLPETTNALVVLDRWPASLPAIDYRPAGLWSERYPTRAIRDGLGGLTGLSLLFGPDGTFEQVWVSRPSGVPALDESAVTWGTRYFRPRLDQLRLDGFAGSSVLVPLVEFEWHMGATDDRPAGAAISPGRIVVVVAPRGLSPGAC